MRNNNIYVLSWTKASWLLNGDINMQFYQSILSMRASLFIKSPGRCSSQYRMPELIQFVVDMEIPASCDVISHRQSHFPLFNHNLETGSFREE